VIGLLKALEKKKYGGRNNELSRERKFLCLAVWKIVTDIFRGQEGHGMLVVYCKCITVSPKGYLVRQRF
jgi:hypothetical protein